MSEIRLPFWVVTERNAASRPPNDPCDMPTAIHAFSTTDGLTTFLDTRNAGALKVSLVANLEGLILAIADIHHTGSTALCFDPDPDGSGGDAVSLADLLVIVERESA